MDEKEFNFNDPEDLSKVMKEHGVMPGSKKPWYKKALSFIIKTLLMSALLYGLYKGGELIVSLFDKI